MRLKKIEVCGFKSFADRVTVKFDSGITGIVGPNGCGKSNVADALRWVMGEQSAKSVRGDKMYDLIFSGSSKRKALAFAEVILVLTEINGALPVDFEEVEIKRRVYRSGESEYYLNGHLVRLKDIQNLLWDTGNSFAHIGQGQVERMVISKPIERRLFFDEAAGISRFRQRRKESKSKLDRTEDNIKRLGDIFREVEKQKKLLERQSQEARVFKENKQRLEFLDKAVILEKLSRLTREKDSYLEKQGVLKKELHDLSKQREDKGVEKELSFKVLKEAQKQVFTCREKYYSLKSERDVVQVGWETAKKRAVEMGVEKGGLELELKGLIQQKEREVKENKQKEIDLKKVAVLLEKVSVNYSESKAQIGTFKKDFEVLQETQKVTQKEYLKAVQEEAGFQTQLQEYEVKFNGALTQIERLKTKKESLSSKESKLSGEEKEKRGQLSSFSKDIENYKTVQKELQKKEKTSVEKVFSLEQTIKKYQKIFTQKQSRFQTLESLKKELEGFSGGAKKLLKESQKKNSALFGKIKGLYELITPKKGQESVVVLALFRYLQTLVVETREDASLVWEEIEKNKIKDCSLFCLEDIVKTNAMKSITFVENSSIASHFFKDLSQGNCVNSLENECVDEKGYYKDHRGVVFCSSKGEHNLFLREAELKELNKDLVDLKAQEEGLNSSFRRAVDEQKELQVKRSENDILLRKSEMKHVEVNFILQTIVKQKQQYVEDNKSIQEELDSLKKECVDLKDRSKDLKETYKGVKSGIQQRLKDTESLEKQLDKMIEKLKVDQLTLESKEQKFQHLKEEYQELQHSINIFSVKEEENKRQQEKIRKDIIERSETGSQVVESLDVLKGKEDSLKIQVQESNLEQKKLEKSEKEVRIELGNYDKILNNLSSRCQGIEKELHKLEIKLAEGKSFKESLLHDLDERFQVTFESLLTLAPKLESSLEDGEKELKLLYQKVEKSGNINLAAIEEFDEVKERYEELEVQIRDLSEAKKELEAIIKELDEKSRSLFKETFEKIRLSFKKNFAILFSGGEADLSLIDSQDILQAGVDITAQPPGKQMRSITLLSGGEKCMTAIALLFALFETKAAPFCMLDEVDAPLDDANVQRFVSLVKEFMHRTQFIIITHNKLTMAAADRLYGVSMQEKGVSKLLMMSFGKEEKDVEYELIEN